MSKTQADYGSGIARPKIDDKDYFELKGQFLKELRDNTFSGSDHKDANEHIEKVLEIVDLFHVPNITQDQNIPQNDTWIYRTRSTKTSDGLAAIQAQLNNLGREIKKVNENVYATQVGSAALRFYQRNNANPSYQERRQSIEESLRKFMIESTKRHEENSNLIKEIRASTNAAIRNQGASIKTLEIQIGTVKHPKGIAENVLVWIGKFVFPVDFIILDISEDVKVPLILERPFLSTAYAKIDMFKRKITLRVGDEKIIFYSVKPASSLIKRVYMLSLRECMKLDLKARLMGETLVLNSLLDPLYGDYIKLNDLNVPLELRRDQVDDLMPTIKEGEWRIWMATEIKTYEMLFLESHSARLHVWKQEAEWNLASVPKAQKFLQGGLELRTQIYSRYNNGRMADMRAHKLRYGELAEQCNMISDMAPLPPREQRHPFLRVQVVDFQWMPELMRDGLFARMAMEHRDDVVSVRRSLETIEMEAVYLGLGITYRGGDGVPRAPEKVTVTDLFYLRGLDVGSVNIPYLLARYLRRFATKRKSGAHISGGQFVARLAEHFGLLTAEILGGLMVIAPELLIIDMAELVRLQICAQFDDTWAWDCSNYGVLGPPGRNTIPPRYFFNNDLEYLKHGNTDKKYALSLSKVKAARYEQEGIEEIIPYLWSSSIHNNEGLKDRKWTKKDKGTTKSMLNKIEKTLKERRRMRRLESFVRGRRVETDYKLLVRPE
ncbi:putative reverse transcriptase domain-containing protein [Tanacetum coccineum]|uniref:Reverse transcriptase domain-containing protein n=1 Tax=Tanacetum coccineum TaxID=301880 RepID=A0ABQ4XJH2_9ASTR